MLPSMGSIVCAGTLVDVPDRNVRTWRFEPKLGFVRMRERKVTRAIVVHFTGGIGDHTQVFRTLTERGLSVHFVVDADGLIFQHCDTRWEAQHCKGANDFSIGIEVVCPGFPPSSHEQPPRTIVKETIHGIDRELTAFYPTQTESVLALVDALCTHYAIPMRVPMRGTDVESTVVPDALLATWRGVLGHNQVSCAKVDPGLSILRAIAAYPLRGKDGAAQ